jgi:hypothetical protein
MRRSFRTRVCFSGYSQGCTLGWYAMPRWGKESETWSTVWNRKYGHMVGAPSSGNAVDGPVTETRWARGIETIIVQYAPTGQRIPAQGIALRTASERIGVF